MIWITIAGFVIMNILLIIGIVLVDIKQKQQELKKEESNGSEPDTEKG